MGTAGGEELGKQAAPEAEIVPSSVTKKEGLSQQETRAEIATTYSYWQHLAVDPQAQREVKDAMLARAAADTAVTNGIAQQHVASAENLRADAAVKQEAARKQRLENDRVEDLKERNRPFVRVALKYGVRLGAGFLFALGLLEGGAGAVRVLRGTGTINLGITGGLIALSILIALAPSAVAAIIGKIK